jgi:orotidine-5'-phosphate decarboxylase
LGFNLQCTCQSIFEDLNFDSVTVAPYMGKDSGGAVLSFETNIPLCWHDQNEGAASIFRLMLDGKELYNRSFKAIWSWKNGET